MVYKYCCRNVVNNEMEFSPSQIARLVLGYLKAEKCQAAFDSFFSTSPHFEYNSNNKRAKYIVTRMHGNSLRDFLNEYAQIYNLVQERLEPTDYYDECSSRNIVDQLTYLLDKCCQTRQNTPQRSRSSTPIKENRRCIFQQNLSIIEEHASSELNTTPLEDLPGNSHDFNHTPGRRGGIKTNKNTAVEEFDSGDSPDNGQEEVEDIEVLKQTLLEHTELHEKIAEHINLVINTTEANKAAEEKLSHELDSAVKAIVERTEADPIFEKLIGDLIGSTEQCDTIDRRYSEETDYRSSPSALPSNIQQESNRGSGDESDIGKQRQRNSKELGPEKSTEIASFTPIQPNKPLQIGQLQAATEIIPKIDNTIPILTTTAPVDVHKNLTVNTNTGDVILYDGTLDNYMKSSTAPIATSTNPIFFNNNLLMVQPGLIQPASVAASLVNGIPMDKSYYLVNNSSQLINAVSSRCTKSTTTKELPKLLPKEPSEPNIREYLTLYQCTDEQQSVVPPKKKTQSKTQKKAPPKTQTIQIEILKPIEKEVKETPSSKDEAKETKPDMADKASSPRPVTPDVNKQAVRKTTPKSASHVRALDFNLTPGNGSLTSTKNSSSKSPRKKSPSKTSSTKISKSLFGSPLKSAKLENSEIKNSGKGDDKVVNKKNGAKEKKLSSWDSDLRALMGPVKEPTPPKKKKKEFVKTSSKKTKVNLNKTEIDAKVIEENLKNIDQNTKENPLKCEIENIRNEERPEGIKAAKEEIQEEVKAEAVNKPEELDNQSVLTFTLINCNAKARCKRKCNIDNTISKAVKITKVKEIKSLELIPDSSNKLILSPSKLNANKRTLVDSVESADKEVDPTAASSGTVQSMPTPEKDANKTLIDKHFDVCQDQSSANHTNEKQISSLNSKEFEKSEQYGNKNDRKDKFTTPDMPRHHNSLPVTANCNLTHILDTPMKYLETPIKSNELPKTPGACIPNIDTITPMTKMLNEQLHGIDILSIQTPLTPSFPFTPFNAKSPYPNRSTDYSTTSSYYQPSDSEQNKSLEVLMEECRRLENKQVSPTKEEKVTQDEVQVHPSISEKMSTFNQSLIARKNLNLVKKDLENSSSDGSTSSEEDSSSCTEDDTNSSGSTWDTGKNETVIQKRSDTPYMLRSRAKEERMSFEKDEIIHDILSHTEVKPELDKHTVVNSKEAILREVEEKRKRTIAKFKQGEKSTPPPRKKPSTIEKVTATQRTTRAKSVPKSKAKPVSRNTNKPIPGEIKATRPTSTNKRKSKSPVKLPQNINDVTHISKDVVLHISSDDDHIRPFDVVETLLVESESSSTAGHPLNTFQKVLDTFKSSLKSKEANETISDQEAKTLVEGLKQRGIYLVPNKTPRKAAKPTDSNIENLEENKPLPFDFIEKNKEEAESVQKAEIASEVIEERSNKDTISIDSPEKPKLSKVKAVVTKGTKVLKKTGVKKTINDSLLNNQNLKNTKGAKSQFLEDNKPAKDEDKSDSTNNVAAVVTNESAIQNEIPNTAASNNLDVTKSEDNKNTTDRKAELRNEEKSKPKSSKSELKDKGQKRTKSATKIRQTKKIEPTKSNSKTPRKGSSESKVKNKNIVRSGDDNKQTQKEELKQQNLQDSKNNISDSLEKNTDLQTKSEVQVLPPSLPAPDSDRVGGTIDEDLNLTDSLYEEVFDDVTFSEEAIRLVYDPHQTSNKKLEDYNLPISNKCFVVEVFGQQIEMSISPFELVLDLPKMESTDKIKILQNTVITSSKDVSPLNKLYDRLRASSSNVDPISPLSNLYSDDRSARYPTRKVQRLKKNERRRNSMDHNREPSTRSRKAARSKSVDYNTLSTSFKEEPNQEIMNKSKSEKPDISTNKIVEQEKSLNSSETISTKITDKKNKLLDSNIKDIIKDVISESPNAKNSPREIDDELMNYAICGSERVENDTEDKGRTNKRKATDNVDDTQLKKIKCQEILQTMNVDEFLTQLHGKS
ncbi:hypothetical protein Trydic_g6154 [Trypoxylus dichotomus]